MYDPEKYQEQESPDLKVISELERFSFGIATSPYAFVEPIVGPNASCTTQVSYGGLVIEHSHHPASGEQRVTASGDSLPEVINGRSFILLTHESLVLDWIPGLAQHMPVEPEVATDLSDAIKSMNDSFDVQA